MREIKFRGWDVELKQMVYNDEQTGYIEYETNPIRALNAILNGDDQGYIYMQYTGIKDKKGKEIYEGDIVLVKAEGYEPIISQVEWGGTEYPAFDLPDYDDYEMNAFASIYHSEPKETIEVIGNIYENPDFID